VSLTERWTRSTSLRAKGRVARSDQLRERLKHGRRHVRPRHPRPAVALVRLKQLRLSPLSQSELGAAAAQVGAPAHRRRFSAHDDRDVVPACLRQRFEGASLSTRSAHRVALMIALFTAANAGGAARRKPVSSSSSRAAHASHVCAWRAKRASSCESGAWRSALRLKASPPRPRGGRPAGPSRPSRASRGAARRAPAAWRERRVLRPHP